MSKWNEESFLTLASLADSGWFKLHRGIVKAVGFEAAAVLHYLIDLYMKSVYEWNDEWDDPGWFCCTVKQIENAGMPKWSQDRIISKLIERGFIEKKRKGAPAKRFLKINVDVISDVIRDWANLHFGESR